MGWYHRVLPIRLDNVYLFFSCYTRDCTSGGELAWQGFEWGRYIPNPNLAHLNNSPRLSFCKAGAFSFSFAMCGPVLWLDWFYADSSGIWGTKGNTKRLKRCSRITLASNHFRKPTPCFVNTSLYVFWKASYLSWPELNCVADNQKKFTNSETEPWTWS